MNNIFVWCGNCCRRDCYKEHGNFNSDYIFGCSHGIDKEKLLKRLNYNFLLRLGFRPKLEEKKAEEKKEHTKEEIYNAIMDALEDLRW